MNPRRFTQLVLVGLPGFSSAALLWEPGDDVGFFVLAFSLALLHTVHHNAKELPSIPTLFVVNLVVLPILLPNFIRPHWLSLLTACKSNVKNLATALEMYSTDNAGHYPRSLREVTPNYLKIIPQCPSAGRVTYCYARAEKPDAYTVWCGGCYHHAAGLNAPNYPQYSCFSGLLLP
jgi:hypothetical protein